MQKLNLRRFTVPLQAFTALFICAGMAWMIVIMAGFNPRPPTVLDIQMRSTEDLSFASINSTAAALAIQMVSELVPTKVVLPPTQIAERPTPTLSYVLIPISGVSPTPTATPRSLLSVLFPPTKHKEDEPTSTPTGTSTNTPTNVPTDVPTNTATSTATSTPAKTSTATAVNTATSTPTNTPTTNPDTPTPTDTLTPTSTPPGKKTDMPTPTPTSTPIINPTDTPVPTDTPTDEPTPTSAPRDHPTPVVIPGTPPPK